MRRYRVEILLACGLMAAWGWFHPFLPLIPNPNETTRFYLTRALVQRGAITIDEEFARYGVSLDRARRGDHYYCDKAPGLSFLAVPFYWAYERWRGPPETRPTPETAADERYPAENLRILHEVSPAIRFLKWPLIILPSVIMAVLLFRYLRRETGSEGAALAATLTWAIGTSAYTNTNVLFGHQLTAVLLFFTFLALERGGRLKQARWLALAGVFAGLALITEFPAAAPVFMLGAAAIARLRWSAWKIAAYPLAAAPFIGLLLYYHQHAFGDPFATGYQFLEDERYHEVHSHGFMGITSPDMEALKGLFIRPDRGLLVYTPVLALVPIGVAVMMMRGAPSLPPALMVVLSGGLLVISFPVWHGGWSVGLRHMVPVLPFLVMPLAHAFRALNRGWVRLLAIPAGALMTAGATVTVLASSSYAYAHPDYFLMPFRDLGGELLRLGYLPPNAGQALGLNGVQSALLHGLIILMLLWTMLWALTMAADEQAPRFRRAGWCSWMLLLGMACVWWWSRQHVEEHPIETFQESRHVMRLYTPRHENRLSPGPQPSPETPPKAQALYWSARYREAVFLLEPGNAIEYRRRAREFFMRARGPETPKSGQP
ncbi:MAG: hypothetical protein GMKNLPBB_01838 [Myxococcota bacterium]|nr:hypothetical protein [Myxococcota bacterium]